MNGYSRMGASTDSSSSLAVVAVADSKSTDLPAEPRDFRQQQQQQQEEIGRFGVPAVPLSRSRSSASQRFASGASATLQAAVKRAFSMRKSSSVREGYWRIHDSTSGDGDEDGPDDGFSEAGEHGGPEQLPPLPDQQQQQQGRRKKKKGKLVRACKRLFGC